MGRPSVEAPHEGAGRRPSDHQLLEWMPDGVLVVSRNGRIVFANERIGQMTGYKPQELEGEKVELLVPKQFRAAHRKDRGNYAAGGSQARAMGGADCDYRMRCKDGSEFSIDIALTPVQIEGEQQTVASVRDITERRQREVETEYRSLHDSLTDLANRALFFERLSQGLLNAKREGKQVALVMLDLDGLKAINDVYGHAVGDELLRELAKRLKEGLRATDTAARIGGDEFVWVLVEVEGRAVVERMVHKRLKALEATFVSGKELIEIKVSTGIALYPDDGRSVGTLMRFADRAMYTFKRRGQVIGARGVL